MRSSAALALALALAAGPARAAGPAGEPSDPVLAAPARVVEARGRFVAGQRAYDTGEFDAALMAFSEAYRLDPRPAILFNMAQCHRQLGREEKALFLLGRYLELEPDSPNAETARELRAELEVKAAEKERAAREERAARLAALRAVAASARPVPPPPPRPAPAVPAAGGLQPSQAPEPEAKRYQQWYVWAGVGAAVVVSGVVAGMLLRPEPQFAGTAALPPQTTL